MSTVSVDALRAELSDLVHQYEAAHDVHERIDLMVRIDRLQSQLQEVACG